MLRTRGREEKVRVEKEEELGGGRSGESLELGRAGRPWAAEEGPGGERKAGRGDRESEGVRGAQSVSHTG